MNSTIENKFSDNTDLQVEPAEGFVPSSEGSLHYLAMCAVTGAPINFILSASAIGRSLLRI